MSHTICFFKCWGIIHSITRHTHNMTLAFLQNIHNMKLMFREHLGKAIGILNRREPSL